MFTDKLLCTKSGTREKETTFAPAGVNFFFFEPTSFPIFLISTSPVSHSHVSCSLFFNTSSAVNYPLKYSIILSTDLYLLTMCQALSLYTGVPSFFLHSFYHLPISQALFLSNWLVCVRTTWLPPGQSLCSNMSCLTWVSWTTHRSHRPSPQPAVASFLLPTN